MKKILVLFALTAIAMVSVNAAGQLEMGCYGRYECE